MARVQRHTPDQPKDRSLTQARPLGAEQETMHTEDLVEDVLDSLLGYAKMMWLTTMEQLSG